MLVVVDDVEVRRCVHAVSAVEAKVRNVGCVTDSRDLVPAFKVSLSLSQCSGFDVWLIIYVNFLLLVIVLIHTVEGRAGTMGESVCACCV